ncbi:MAG: helix-turn-helix domain-containing protein [Bacteroidota bacterium]|nr:helix-turn-helix domain-containing protein [Bacteroidota bacterium]
MFQIILNYLSVALAIQALIVFVEVLINFKRPFSLKSMMLAMVISIAWRGIGSVYCNYYGYNRWIMELPGPIMGAASISFFSIIYQNSIKKYVIIFGIIMILTQWIFMFYYSFIEPIDQGIQLINDPVMGGYVKFLKMFFVTVILGLNVDLFRKIFRKYPPDNMYFIKLRTWSPFLIVAFMLMWTGNIIKNSIPNENTFHQILFITGNFAILLIFLFRPKFLNRTNLKITLGDFFNIKAKSELSNQAFHEAFFNKAYFLNKEASLDVLSKQLDVSTEELGNFIFNNYGLGFNDLVNKHRILYFMELVSSGKYGNYTIDALAQDSGFSSRHHLYKPFKKFHGGTPSDFMRSVAK